MAISKFVSRADNGWASDTKYVSGKTRAVVLGASIAGLLAGRVLANYFDEVILIDKEELDEGAVARKAVPQGNYVHVILTPTSRCCKNSFRTCRRTCRARCISTGRRQRRARH